MPLCAQELHRRGLKYPLLVGGAAINPSFVRTASLIAEQQPYPAGMFYCKDAFEGLETMDRLMAADGEEFVAAHNAEMMRRQAEYEARRAQAKDLRPASRENASVPPVEVPTPPFWGWKVLLGIPLDDVVECIDRNTLYRMQWGARNLKGEEWDRIVREDFEPRLARYTLEARTQRWLSPKAVYGYFPAARVEDSVVVYDPADRTTELGRFDFPRQEDREQLVAGGLLSPAERQRPGGRDRPAGGDERRPRAGVHRKAQRRAGTTPRGTSCTASACRRRRGRRSS